jgi:hypothetical protein
LSNVSLRPVNVGTMVKLLFVKSKQINNDE